MLKKRGQSTLEYVIILIAIVAAVIAGVVLVAQRNKTTGIGKLMDKATDRITDATGQLPGVDQPIEIPTPQ